MASTAAISNLQGGATRKRVKKSKKAPKTLAGPGFYNYNKAPQGITNHGGPVMNSPIKIYITWVGSISSAQKQLTRTFISSLSPQTGSVAGTGKRTSRPSMHHHGNRDGVHPHFHAC
jgi:hypothetical protein